MTASAEFTTAIQTYTSDAKSLFDAGHRALTPGGPPLPPPSSDDATKRAQGTMGAGFSQLGQAAKMESEQAGRAGYAAVVKLMQSTADAADGIGKRLVAIVGTPTAGTTTYPPFDSADLPLIQALTEALRALAQLSPAAVWAKPAGDASS